MNIKAIVRGNRFLYTVARKIQRLKQKWKYPILGKNNKIINKGVLNNVKYDIIGNNNLVEIMPGTVLSDMMIYIRGSNHRFKINRNCFFIGGNVWFEDNNCQIEIGENTTIESAHLAVTEPGRKITIGNDCMFSKEIEFRTGDSHSIIDKQTKIRINFAEDIEIGDHVWIGARSIVLKGVIIGNNSIIGTNSVVTKSIPAHSIAAGTPAKVIKTGIDWMRQRI